MERALILFSAVLSVALIGCGTLARPAADPVPRERVVAVAAAPNESRMTLDVLELI